jgi:flavin-dependent dehydrogenase
MLAAEAAFSALTSDETAGTSGDRAVSLTSYPDAIKASWVWDELHVARNIRPVSPFNRFILSVTLFGLLCSVEFQSGFLVRNSREELFGY